MLSPFLITMYPISNGYAIPEGKFLVFRLKLADGSEQRLIRGAYVGAWSCLLGWDKVLNQLAPCKYAFSHEERESLAAASLVAVEGGGHWRLDFEDFERLAVAYYGTDRYGFPDVAFVDEMFAKYGKTREIDQILGPKINAENWERWFEWAEEEFSTKEFLYVKPRAT